MERWHFAGHNCCRRGQEVDFTRNIIELEETGTGGMHLFHRQVLLTREIESRCWLLGVSVSNLRLKVTSRGGSQANNSSTPPVSAPDAVHGCMYLQHKISPCA